MSETVLKKLDGTEVTVAAPTRREKKEPFASRTSVQRVRLADGTIQEIAVTERRTQTAHDRMLRRERLKSPESPGPTESPEPTVKTKFFAPIDSNAPTKPPKTTA